MPRPRPIRMGSYSNLPILRAETARLTGLMVGKEFSDAI